MKQTTHKPINKLSYQELASIYGSKFVGKTKEQLIEELTAKKQTHKVGIAGSFINQMMSNNSTLPVVGKGATEMLYSDRHCYEVIEVSEDGKNVKLEYLDAEFAGEKGKAQIGHQDWNLKPTGRFLTLVWRQGAWRKVGKEIVFEDKFVEECRAKGIDFIGMYLRKNNPELADKIWGVEGSVTPINVVEGYTREKKSYDKIRIIFGVKDYHYDWTI